MDQNRDQEARDVLEQSDLSGADVSRMFGVALREGQRWRMGTSSMPMAISMSLRIVGAVRRRTPFPELVAMLRAEAEALERRHAERATQEGVKG